MKKNMEIVCILDRSGSMSGLESDTIGGYNAFIERERKECENSYVTTVLFDDRYDILVDRKKITEVPKLTEKEYTVRGCTALVDAVGKTIRHIEKIHQYVRPEDVPDHTVFMITTDGKENASHLYSAEDV
ncbi:MAG: VWA domain-containing protein, partial [Erysipelotrichales bacterium]|nr:VWA domain-containing protein [Erysipelotrichales bacterium]